MSYLDLHALRKPAGGNWSQIHCKFCCCLHWVWFRAGFKDELIDFHRVLNQDTAWRTVSGK
jgi:hypothetical protein